MKRTKRRLKLGLPVIEAEQEGLVATRIRRELKIAKEKVVKPEKETKEAKMEAEMWKRKYMELKVHLYFFLF